MDNFIYEKPDITPYEYDKEYFTEYSHRENSIDNIVLNRLRLNIVKKHTTIDDIIVDYGCGVGAFIKSAYSSLMNTIYGYDVNKITIEWLKNKNILFGKSMLDTDQSTYVIVFWDSFEHMTAEEHEILLNKSIKSIFISLPIIKDISNYKISKHYKPREHLWYFTSKGIIDYISSYGYTLIDISDMETRAGRDDIYTFVFERV